MPWGLEDLETYITEFKGVPVRKWRKGVIGLGSGPKADGGTDTVPEFQVAGEKVCVKMCQENVADVTSVLGSILQIVVNVALRVNDNRRTGRRVGDQIRGVRQTAKVILF
jgi:hypothetical protein